MDRRMIVEVLDERGRVTQRVALADDTFTVGRALDNDVILDDPHLDARHARIERSGTEEADWSVTDLESVNGTSVRGTRLSAGGSARFALRDEIRVGGTTLRLVSAQAGDAAPVIMHPRLFERFRPGLAAAFAAAGVAAILGGLLAWISWYEPDPGYGLAGGIIATLLGISLWAGVWAIGNRIFGGRANFRLHATIASLAISAYIITGYGWGFVEFAAPGSGVASVVATVFGLAGFGLPLLAHIDVASARSARFKARLTAAITLGLFVIGNLLAGAATSDGDAVQAALGTIRPLPVRLVVTRSVDDFAEELDQLRLDLDQTTE